LTEEAPQKLGELEFRRLLVAIDGSGNSELALSAAITAARRSNAAVTLVYVAPDVVADAARFPSAAQYVPSDQDEVDRHGEHVLSRAVDVIPDDIPVTKILRRGRAGEQIVAASNESNYDAILMGARGVGRIGALLGSVSQYVTRHAKIAVFVAHAPRD
jgi:nucleotide-binding universal stress UspA family protein